MSIEHKPVQIDLDAIQSYFAGQPEVVAAYLFGSVARGRADHRSDVDIAVLLDACIDERASVELQLRFMGDLEAFTDREVQVAILNRAPPLLAYQVIRDRTILFERDRQARIEFEVRAAKIYFDVKPMLDAFDRRAIERSKEGIDGFSPRQSRRQKTLDAAERLYQRFVDVSGHRELPG